MFHPTEVKKPVKLALSVCADDAEADVADPLHMYYVNDGVYGSFNCILYDHVTVEASLVDVSAFWILLKQETVSGSGISWAVCKSAPRSRQITTPAPHHGGDRER